MRRATLAEKLGHAPNYNALVFPSVFAYQNTNRASGHSRTCTRFILSGPTIRPCAHDRASSTDRILTVTTMNWYPDPLIGSWSSSTNKIFLAALAEVDLHLSFLVEHKKFSRKLGERFRDVSSLNPYSFRMPTENHKKLLHKRTKNTSAFSSMNFSIYILRNGSDETNPRYSHRE
jgi:hypothetical protein